jgi:hypothetical protein
MPLSFPIAEHLRPTPSSAFVACRALILRAESGTRASRADQGFALQILPHSPVWKTK